MEINTVEVTTKVLEGGEHTLEWSVLCYTDTTEESVELANYLSSMLVQWMKEHLDE